MEGEALMRLFLMLLGIILAQVSLIIAFHTSHIIVSVLLLFASVYELINLVLAGLFLIQATLVIPNKLPPLTKKGSVIARTAVPKIMFSLTIINFFSAYYVTQVDYIPHAAMYGHLIMGVFPIFPAYFLLTGKIEIVD